MADWEETWFTVTVDDDQKLFYLYLPDYVKFVLRGRIKEVKVQRGDDDSTTYGVKLKKVRTSSRKKLMFGDGWEVFVEENGVAFGDLLVITLIGYASFKVVVLRDGAVVPGGVVLISSDSGDDEGANEGANEGGGEDIAAEPIQQPHPNPFFKFKFIKSYIFKPTINIPLPFAQANFSDLGDPCIVVLMGNQAWDATLHIKRNQHGKVTSCYIKKGVQQFIDGEGVTLGAKYIVELVSLHPPTLTLISY